MKRNLKNRALLRQLLGAEVSQHLALIEEAATKEEVLLDAAGNAVPTGSKEAKEMKAKEIKAFDFKFDEKALVVPSFRWKTTESKEKLQAYADSLKKLVESIEEHLTRP
jgi:hypothetical protein